MSTQMAGTHSNSQMIKIRTTIVTIIMILLAIISLLPIYILVVNATRTSVDISGHGISLIPGLNLFNNIGTLMDWSATNKIQYDALIGYRNSGIIAFSTTILTVLFSGMTAYGLVVYDFKLKNIAYTIILAVMMIPVQVTSVGFYQFMSRLGLTDSYIPLIIPAVAAPAVVFFMRQYMKSSFPLEIVEAARIDGRADSLDLMQLGDNRDEAIRCENYHAERVEQPAALFLRSDRRERQRENQQSDTHKHNGLSLRQNHTHDTAVSILKICNWRKERLIRWWFPESVTNWHRRRK